MSLIQELIDEANKPLLELADDIYCPVCTCVLNTQGCKGVDCKFEDNEDVEYDDDEELEERNAWYNNTK